MQRQTNLEAIKSVALQFLDQPMKEVGERESPHHPFSRNGFYFVGDDEFRLVEGTPIFDTWKAEKKKSIENAETARQVCSLLADDWFVRFLLAVESDLSEEEFSEIFIAHFRYASYLGLEDNDNGNTDIVDCFRKCNPALIMDEDEQKIYNALPDDILLYHGAPVKSPEEIGKVFLWFDDLVGVKGLIRDYYECADIYTATIDKEHILAYIDTGVRKSTYDSEAYIVDPQHLKNIEFVESYISTD